ncbi:MAG TPA: Gfo/Idh/MocA family oxidoreductase [Bryobacteraceae bacterium]|nr:Gfo/Idh/MocA family oxidoreductase [Bryobacteraceae bacterium]
MRIAVLGVGFMGSTHIRALSNIPNGKLAAVFSNDPKKLRGELTGIQGNLGGEGQVYDFTEVKKYRDLHLLLADPEIDAVDICLPTDMHTAVAMEALRAGKHVLVEKPMALTGELADQMIEEARKSGRVLMSAQVLRFVPAYRALIAAIESGSYGPVRTALFRRQCAAPGWSGWLADSSRSGGGVFDLLIHDVDMCIRLFGAPASVSATGYEDLANGVDTLAATLHYRDVPSVVVTGGWQHPKAYPFSMEYTVTTQGGTFEYSSARTVSTIFTAAGESQPMELPEQDGFEAELSYFIECCKTNQTPALCPPKQSAAAVKVLLTMLESRKQDGLRLECRV